MSDVKRYQIGSRDIPASAAVFLPSEVVSSADYDALAAAHEQAWKSATSESHAWAREFEARMRVVAERDQLRAERDSLFAERRQLESELRHRQKLIDDAWHAWDVALKGCEAMRAERDSHQRLCIAEMEKNAKLRAELEAIRGQEVVGYQYQDRNGEWHGFYDELHYQNTVEDGTWPIRAIYALPPQQPDAVSVPGVLEFAVEILRGALEGGSFDGGDIQEMGVKYGLLFPEQRTERCGEHCECAEYGFPVECFRIARALLSTKNAEEV